MPLRFILLAGRMSSAPNESRRDTLATLRIDRSPQPTGRLSRWLSRLLILMLLIALGTTAWWYADQSGWLADKFAMGTLLQPRIEVQVGSVVVQTGRSGDAAVVASGYLESRRQAMIGARVPGRIEVINVEEGMQVKTGAVMAVLEHADLDAALVAAKATLGRAEAEKAEQDVEVARASRAFERIRGLNTSVSVDELDQAKFRYDSAVAKLGSLQAAIDLAKARVQEAEQLRENMFIRAPFDGTVISKTSEVGESILPGGMGEASGRGSVVTIADLEHLEVDCDVKEDFIGRVQVGQEAEVDVDAVPGRRYRGQVRKIIPMGDRARATIKVKVAILDADQRLFPEMSSTVYFLNPQSTTTTENQSRIFCPTASIVTDENGDTFVWIVDSESRVTRRQVTPNGNDQDGRREISSGLSGSEQVVINPPESLKPDQLVKF